MCAVLLMKTTSLGDVIHNLPVVNDIYRFNPACALDWCVEAPFSEIVQLHPHVRRVIPVELRKWRKNLLQCSTWRAFKELKQNLQSTPYTHIIDSQGLIKSAVLAKMARGKRIGFAKNVIKEKWASFFYDETWPIPRVQNAVERNRQLAAAALGYDLSAPADYGLVTPPVQHKGWVSQPYIVALSASSRLDKMWPHAQWQALVQQFESFCWVFPSGNDHERQNVQALIAPLKNAIAAPPMGLGELSAWIARAVAVVGMDTGLTHLGAALNVPSIAVFLKSDPALTGLYGEKGCFNLGGFNQSVPWQEVAHHLKRILAEKNKG